MAPGSMTKTKNGKRTKKTRKASPEFRPDLVIAWRRGRKLSQGEVARRLEYDRTSISKIEHMERGEEPPDKFWDHFKKTFKGTNPKVDFYRRNGEKP